MYTSLDSVIHDQLYAELGLYSAILKAISANPSNHSWFFELLEQIDPEARIELLSHAIGASCQSPLEPVLIGLLTRLFDQYPSLFTLKTAEVIANHGTDKSDQWLVQQADTIVALSASSDTRFLSGILGFSRDLAAAIVEKNPEFAPLNPFAPDYKPSLPEGVTVIPTIWKPDYDYTTSPVGQRILQLYTLAESGDETAFASLYVLSDDYRVSIPVQGVVTHFLGKLWPHERVLEQLCLLVQNDKSWDKISDTYLPVRLEAAEALCNTGASTAWEALIDVIFLTPRFNSAYVDWLTDLTDVLSNTPSTRKDGSWNIHLPGVERRSNTSDDSSREKGVWNRKDFIWTVEDRPWFQYLGDATDDLDAILRDQ